LKLALKIDVDSLRATREGVPRVMEILKRHAAGGTFFFAVGPDHSGVYGKLIPAPDIGRRGPEAMRAARDAGFEVGMLGWSCARWRRQVVQADADWTARQVSLAMERFEEIFGERPSVHGASAWRMNKHAFRNTQALGFDYASDTRGTSPFIPVIRAEIVACPQVPTTLPTLDEAAASALLQETSALRQHVFTLRAGSSAASHFEELVQGWKSQGYELVGLRDLLAEVAGNSLPMHTVLDDGPVARQGPEFLDKLDPGPSPPGGRGDDLS
jgi:undecaprenyl phosphate-alpha-L-ara4FN deformylase